VFNSKAQFEGEHGGIYRLVLPGAVRVDCNAIVDEKGGKFFKFPFGSQKTIWKDFYYSSWMKSRISKKE